MSGAVIDALNDGPCHFFAKGVAGRAICTKAPARTYTFARPAAYKTDGTARCARRDLAGAAGCIATGRTSLHGEKPHGNIAGQATNNARIFFIASASP